MTEVHLPTRDECIYTAGLFDGEGSAVLTIRKVKNLRYPDRPYRSVVMCASITNTYLPVLLWVKVRWGGTVSTTNRDRPQDHGPCFIWNTTAANAARFLVDIAPYVQIKRAQVNNALALQGTTRRRGSKALTDAEWETAMTFLRRQRELNGRSSASEAISTATEPHGDK